MAEANKKPNFFVRTGRGIAKWFREMKSELKKVVWPTPQQVGKNTLIVGGCCGIVGLFIILFDLFANIGIDFIINIPNFFA